MAIFSETIKPMLREPWKNQSKVKEITGEEAFYQFSLLKKSVFCGYIAASF